MNNDSLYHHGIKGQQWGVRRFQNPDGTLTLSGRKRLAEKEYELARLKIFDENLDKNTKKYAMAKAKQDYRDAIQQAKYDDQVTRDQAYEARRDARRKAVGTFLKVAGVGVGIAIAANYVMNKKREADEVEKSLTFEKLANEAKQLKLDTLKEKNKEKEAKRKIIQDAKDAAKDKKDRQEEAKQLKRDAVKEKNKEKEKEAKRKIIQDAKQLKLEAIKEKKDRQEEDRFVSRNKKLNKKIDRSEAKALDLTEKYLEKSKNAKLLEASYGWGSSLKEQASAIKTKNKMLAQNDKSISTRSKLEDNAYWAVRKLGFDRASVALDIPISQLHFIMETH